MQKKDTKIQKKETRIPLHKRPVLPDQELLLWEKWIKIRQEETTGLGKRLERPPVDLAMNLLANVREDKERKIALEHAQLEKKIGVRGSLWDRPTRLKQHCYCAPAYEVHRTAAEKGRPRIVEHIGVPAYVRETELGQAGAKLRQPCTQLNKDYEIYRDLREIELADKISKIDPYRPEMDELMIRGRNPPTPPPKLPPLPEINIFEPENPIEKPLRGVYALQVNNSVFYKKKSGLNLDHLPACQEDPAEICASWTYYFNVSEKRAGQCKLFLQNLGTVTLRYCWKKIKQPINFIPEGVYEQVFFFNTNEDVISPGLIKEIYFSFIADQPGIFSEIWQLSLSNVDFFDKSGKSFIVKLYADSFNDVETIVKKVEALKRRIAEKTMYILASELFEEIFDKIFEIVPQIYPYKKYFLEAEIFVMKNPVCFYHQTEVNKMMGLYTEMVKGETWDLSIGSWRQKMMAKEYEDRMKYYELLRLSHSEFLKPWYERDGLMKEKLRTVKYLLNKFADLFDKEFARVTDLFIDPPPPPQPQAKASQIKSKAVLRSNIFDRPSVSVVTSPITEQMLRNIFYMRIYDHLGATVELCAGVLSSLDLNRWIDFDFCRHD